MAQSKTYELMLKIGGRADSSLKNACLAADRNLASLGKTARSAGKVVAGAAIATATAVGTVGVAAVKAAAEYETQLANISTLLTGTEAEVATRTSQIGDQVLKVSNRTGVATSDLTDGMYQVVSAFGDSEDAISILETAAKAAAAGNATTTDSINLLSAVTKGYGDTSAEAVQKAADLSFATVRLGQTSFPELAASMGKVIPLAGTLGVEQEQLFGAMATLTGVTGSTSEVVTQLKATMQGFLSPSKTMAASLEAMGYESGQALLESKGLQGALDALKDSVGGNELAFAGLFSSVEAQTAVLAMAGTQSENLTNKTAEMYRATGAADVAFQRQTDTMQYTIQMIKNLGANFLTEIGTHMLPYVRDLAEAALPQVQSALEIVGIYVVNTIIPAVVETVGWISEHSDVVLALVGAIASAVAAYKIAKGVLTVYNTVTSLSRVLGIAAAGATAGQTAATVAQAAATTGAIAPTTALAAATSSLCWPLLLVVGIIAAVVAAVILLVKNWDKVKATAIAVWEKIKSVWAGVSTWFKDKVITPVVNFFSTVVGAVTGFFSNLRENIKGIWNGVASWFQNRVIAPIVNFFTPIINTVGGIFQGTWLIIQAVWKVVSTWFKDNVITPVVTVFSTIVGTVSGFFSTLWGNIVAIWTTVSSWFSNNVIVPVVTTFSTVVGTVSGFFSTLWANIVAVWQAAGAWFSEYVAAPINNAFQAVSNFVRGVFNNLLGFVEGMINGVIGAINKFIGGFNSAVGKAAAFVGVDWGGVSTLPQVSLPRLATGGIATGPTLAEIGEGGEPEAILPLSKLAALLDQWGGKPEHSGDFRGGDGEARITFAPVFHFHGPANRQDVEEATRISFEEFKRMMDRWETEKRRKRFNLT